MKQRQKGTSKQLEKSKEKLLLQDKFDRGTFEIGKCDAVRLGNAVSLLELVNRLLKALCLLYAFRQFELYPWVGFFHSFRLPEVGMRNVKYKEEIKKYTQYSCSIKNFVFILQPIIQSFSRLAL